MILREYLKSEWEKIGFEVDDTILVHSSLKRLFRRILKAGYRDFTANDVLESLIDHVGVGGTLIFPLFNFGYPKQEIFDINMTPSEMGALTEAARLHPSSTRSGHPIYSFATIGKHAVDFGKIDNRSGYGEDSPFGLLRELNGKIAVIGLDDQNSMTFFHHVEELCDVDYRYHKEFTSLYIDSNGNKQQKTYSLFVRNVENGVCTHVNPAGEMLWEAGVFHGFRHTEDVGVRWCFANELFDFTSNLIKSGMALDNLYRIDKG